MRRIFELIVSGVVGALAISLVFFFIVNKNIDSLSPKTVKYVFNTPEDTLISNPKLTSNSVENRVDFTVAAESTVNAVVHVKNVAKYTSYGYNSIYDLLYGKRSEREQQQVGTGSGVIITPDGYIITNNHVIENADDIEITLNDKKSYKAKLVGTDPNTDIALLKIDIENAPFIPFANSDNVKIGEWVLAVGNPYNLNSTVTAGIISAKGRRINVLNKRNAVESFLQTDAVVNPGNSGGALVNARGQLIGINTAISSRTGSYIGYSFAVPSNIARKIIEDLIEFGNVRRAYIGISVVELDTEVAKNLNVDRTQGIYISDIVEDGGADIAGIEAGDIIIQIDDVVINKYGDMSGYLSTKRPEEKIKVKILRDDEAEWFEVALGGNTANSLSNEILGLGITNITKDLREKFDISGGVIINEILNEDLSFYDLEGYIIVKINNDIIENTNDVENVLSELRSGIIRLEMLNRNGELERYTYRLDR